MARLAVAIHRARHKFLQAPSGVGSAAARCNISSCNCNTVTTTSYGRSLEVLLANLKWLYNVLDDFPSP
jgi:Rad3-related DNA helicase